MLIQMFSIFIWWIDRNLRQGGSTEKAQGLPGPLLYASSKGLQLKARIGRHLKPSDESDAGTRVHDKGGAGHLLGLGELKTILIE